MSLFWYEAGEEEEGPARVKALQGQGPTGTRSKSNPVELLFNMCSCESGCSYRNYC